MYKTSLYHGNRVLLGDLRRPRKDYLIDIPSIKLWYLVEWVEEEGEVWASTTLTQQDADQM